jgi:hypothetical protein
MALLSGGTDVNVEGYERKVGYSMSPTVRQSTCEVTHTRKQSAGPGCQQATRYTRVQKKMTLAICQCQDSRLGTAMNISYMTMADLPENEDFGSDIDSESDIDSDKKAILMRSHVKIKRIGVITRALAASSPCWRVFQACKDHETMNGVNASERSLLNTLEGKTQGDYSESIIDRAISDWNLPNFPTLQSFLPSLLRQCRCRTKPLPRAALQRQIRQWNNALAALMTGESSSLSTTWN